MYKIGNTSGLEEKNCDEGKETVKIVGEIVDKMAKKCADVPKKMTTPNKIMEITDGCFSSAQVIEVKDEKCGGASSDDESKSEEEKAAEEAAKTSGGCGGGKSSESKKKEATCNKKSCCGGKNTTQDQCTGSKLVESFIPSTVDDMLTSGVSNLLGAQSAAEEQFMNSYCAFQPFPECATCPYGRRFRNSPERDLNRLFQQMRAAMSSLLAGDYQTSSGMFVCPGLVGSVLNADLGPLAYVAGANAVAAVLSLTSVRGALDSFQGIATSAFYTDFRMEVMRSVDTLFRSGSCVGIPGAFVDQVNAILVSIGCGANTFTRMTTRSGSSRSSRFGGGKTKWGKKTSSVKTKVTTKSSPANTQKKSRVYKTTEEAPVDDAIPAVYKSAARQEPTTESVEKAEKARKEVTKSLEAAKEVSSNPAPAKEAGKLKPTQTTKTYNTTPDKTAKPGKTYYKKDTTSSGTTTRTTTPSTTSSSKPKYIKIEVKNEQPLDVIEAQVGPIFDVEDNGITEPEPTVIEVTSGTRAIDGKIYSYKDPITNEPVTIKTKPGELIKPKKEEVEAKLRTKVEIGVRDKPNPVYLTYKKTTDTKAVKGKVYYRPKKNEETGEIETGYEPVVIEEGVPITEDLFVQEEDERISYHPTMAETPVADIEYYTPDETGVFVKIEQLEEVFPVDVEIYEKIIAPSNQLAPATSFDCSGPVILNNGLMIEEPTFLDMESQDVGVDTKSLITDGRVPAAEMVRMHELNLSLYEVKMAYLLDHEQNGSVMPVDVEAKPITTILDTIADND